MSLDFLEIQKTIEEKRLIWGRRLERYLLSKMSMTIRGFAQILQKLFLQEKSTFVTCALIIFSSIFIRSSLDIGHDSASYINIAQKILRGGKYYYDFFENNFPLAFYLTVIPVFVAKFFLINPIIALEIFVNLIGILSIYFSTLILNKSNKTYSRGQIQLLIICFCVGYFLRVYNLQFNEYGTKSSYFLALAFPYISYQIVYFYQDSQSRKTQIIIGILAGLIICLKPCYILLPAVFEFSKLYLKDNSIFLKSSLKVNSFSKIFSRSTADNSRHVHFITILQLFCLRNLTTLFLISGYLLLILKLTPEYSAFLSQFSALYFNAEYIHYFDVIKNNIFPLLLLSVVALPYLAKHTIFKPLFSSAIATSLIIIFELVGGYDQLSIFFSISLALVAAIVFFLLQEKKINWKKDGLLILIILLLPQFDAQSFFAFGLNLCYLWWLILFFDKNADRCLYVLAFINIALIIFDKSGEISWLLSALIFLILFKPKISFLAKNNEKNLYLSKPAAIFISLALSYFISLFSAAIFNQQNLYAAKFKSPNYLNERKAFFIEKYAAKNNEQIIFIADEIKDSYPISVYFNKINPLPSLQLIMLYKNIYENSELDNKNIFHGKSENENKTLSHIFQSLKVQISKSNNKLIFIERKNYWGNECRVGFLEYYFQDEEFRKTFAKNYVFIDEIIVTKKDQMLSNLLTSGRNESILGEREIITEKIEVYLNKN